MPSKVTEFISPRLGTTGLNSRRRGLEAILRAGKATDGEGWDLTCAFY